MRVHHTALAATFVPAAAVAATLLPDLGHRPPARLRSAADRATLTPRCARHAGHPDAGGPLHATVSPTSDEQLIPPIGTSYTFTPIEFEGAAPELTFDLRSAKPRPLPRPGLKPQLGAVAVSTTFVISDPPSFHEVSDAPPSGNTLEPGTYRVRGIGGLPDLIITVPSNPCRIRQRNTIIGGLHIAHCFWDDEATANICIDVDDAIDFDTFTLRPSSVADPYVSLDEVLDYIATSTRMVPARAAER